ncbi:alpha/beta hydrolase [Sporothrix brasiliensis 5110]|uniref:Alpha/beta hydrolase n=1 Tax=Sporothrix brasiliensis 5110 TaxID=1398154 RepID=A0A0C2ENJ0_9PEZI|nr:alpha/beta hydrolase [Sporothrix brasiliensis 5110]KIH87669.1 alpha/beta hydrolase [Sporothrix brasiliensis 5110]
MSSAAPSQPAPAPDRDSQTVTLPDGRTLGFAEYGAPEGAPVLYFHGFPSNRLEGQAMDKSAKRHKVRLLCLDRPGYGLSTLQPGRRMLDWPDDVMAFASTQNLSKFGVLGGSGGGPYVLACASKLPAGVLTHVGVMCGGGAFDRASRAAGVIPRRSRVTVWFATYWPWALRVMVAGLAGTIQWVVRTRMVSRWIDNWFAAMDKKQAEHKTEEKQRKEAAKAKAIALADTQSEGSIAGSDFEEVAAVAASVESLSTVATTKPGSTKAADDDVHGVHEADPEDEEDGEPKRSIPERREAMFRALFHTFAQGAEPTVQDAQVLCSDLGFRFEDITYDPVMFWHGDQDTNTPLPWIQQITDRMPHAVLKVYPGESHYSLVGHIDEIVAYFSPKASEAGEKTAPEDAEGK